MRVFFFVLGCLNLTVLHADSFDSRADELIYNSLSSNEFSNTRIVYPYEDREYLIQMIHNPKREALWGVGIMNPLTHSLVMVGDLPLSLQHHIGEICGKLVNPADCFLNLAGRFFDLLGNNCAEAVKDLAPVYIANQINDPEIEKTIKDLFLSTLFVNRVFYYCIDGNFCRVRLLVNPEGRTLTTNIPWTVNVSDEKVSGISLVYWNHKYGIMADRKCPPGLIDYLSHLADVSLLDWYMHFEITEGEIIQVNGSNEQIKFSGSTPWFFWAENLE